MRTLLAMALLVVSASALADQPNMGSRALNRTDDMEKKAQMSMLKNALEVNQITLDEKPIPQCEKPVFIALAYWSQAGNLDWDALSDLLTPEEFNLTDRLIHHSELVVQGRIRNTPDQLRQWLFNRQMLAKRCKSFITNDAARAAEQQHFADQMQGK